MAVLRPVLQLLLLRVDATRPVFIEWPNPLRAIQRFSWKSEPGHADWPWAFLQVYTDGPMISICSSQEETEDTVALVI